MATLKHVSTACITGSMSGSRPIAVLVDDEAIVRAAAADLLSDFGFEVLQAEHAEGALQHLEAREGAALLYTDVNMPGRWTAATSRIPSAHAGRTRGSSSV
jgi:two-component system, response regulator PdtaR